MTGPAEGEWSEWVGRVETADDTVTAEPARRLFAALDIDHTLVEGDPLPPGWHRLYFNAFPRGGELGADGHPKRGGFLPLVPSPRWMWAGGSITYHTPISVGAQARRHGEIREVRSTSGRTGRLVFVTVHHVISTGDTTCVVEDQNIVYRGEQTAGHPAPSPANELTTPADRSDTMTPDSTLL